MRRLLIPLGVVLALLVGIHYAPWHWSHAKSGSHQATAAAPTDHAICGTVADVHYARHNRGQPTFIDLGHEYPNQNFTIIIWQSNLGRFKPPPESLEGKTICVIGHVRLYKGRPEIIAYGPDQIKIKN